MNNYLEKLIKYIEEHPLKCICNVLILGLVVPLVIQVPYWIGRYYVLIDTDFKASDILSFWGNFLAFITTTALGLLALWQNKIIQNKAGQENKALQDQNKILREQDVDRYKLECISKYYSNIIFCDYIQINVNDIFENIESLEEIYHQVLCKDKLDNHSKGRCIEIKFCFKQLNQYVPKNIKINSILFHYSDCKTKDGGETIDGGKTLMLKSKNKYFSPLNINLEEKLKMSATLLINNCLCEEDIKDNSDKYMISEIRNSKQIFMKVSVSIKNPFNIITNVNYLIQLKKIEEKFNEEYLNFKIEDVKMQLSELSMAE